MAQTRIQARKEKEKLLELFNQEDELQGLSKKTSSQMEVLFGSEAETKTLNVGDIVKGKVVGLQNEFVLMDVSYKSEGVTPLSEIQFSEDEKVEVGSEFDVYVESLENENGMVVLSYHKAQTQKVWNQISNDQNKITEGTVLRKVKGGFQVDIGIKAFLPGSQIDHRSLKTFDSNVGKKMKFKVIKFNRKRGNIVLSRKSLLEDSRKKMSENVTIEEGKTVKGLVKNITDYGAFLDLGGLDGLLHVTDMSWSRIKHPSQLLSLGDEIEVKVLKFDKEKQRVSLGMKQLGKNPWDEVETKYPKGTKIKVKVLNMTDYGVFVRLEEGVEGFIHVTELTWDKKVKKPKQLLEKDDEFEAEVLEIDKDNHRLSLSRKKLEKNPWSEVEVKYPVGSQHKVKIINVADFGLFVELEKNLEGLIHVSELSNSRVENIGEKFKVGDFIKAEVISLDKSVQKINFSVKVMNSVREKQGVYSSESKEDPKPTYLESLLKKTLGFSKEDKEEDKTEDKKEDQ